MDRGSQGAAGAAGTADGPAYAHVGSTLLAGLLLSIAVMVLGMVLTVAEGKKEAIQVLPLDQVPGHLLAGNPPAILDAGILLLFATPLLGVLVALVEFARQGDRPFALITLFLLVLLAAGFAIALR